MIVILEKAINNFPFLKIYKFDEVGLNEPLNAADFP